MGYRGRLRIRRDPGRIPSLWRNGRVLIMLTLNDIETIENDDAPQDE